MKINRNTIITVALGGVVMIVLLAGLASGPGIGPLAAFASPLQAVTPQKPVSPASGQQTTGTPGAPNATTTIDGNSVPNPPPAFGGTINLTAKDSKPSWPPTIVPPKGAPNVLLIMTDDQGYGISSTFGGVIPTPAMDR